MQRRKKKEYAKKTTNKDKQSKPGKMWNASVKMWKKRGEGTQLQVIYGIVRASAELKEKRDYPSARSRDSVYLIQGLAWPGHRTAFPGDHHLNVEPAQLRDPPHWLEIKKTSVSEHEYPY